MRLWALTFLFGILAVQQLSSLPPLYFSVVGILSFIVFIPPLKNAKYRWILVAAAGFVFGFSWALIHAHYMLEQQLLPQHEAIEIVVEGRVASLPIQYNKMRINATHSNRTRFKSSRYKKNKWQSKQRLRFEFIPLKIISPRNIALKNFPNRVRLTWYRPSVKVEAGQTWRFKVKLKRPYALMNPGSFDNERYLFQKRIQAIGYIRNSSLNERLLDDVFSFSKSLLKIRQQILNKLSSDSNNSSTNSIRSLTQALILGHRGGIEAAQWRIFQRTGTIHLMAISGLHIGLVAGLVYGLVNLLWRLFGCGCVRLPAPQVAAVTALTAAIFYAMLAGFTIPTQRALIMLLVAMIHIVFKRTPLPASITIALAGILVLLLDPLAVLAQGFWLSFLAVSLIIYLMRQSSNKQCIEDVYSEVTDVKTTSKNFNIIKKLSPPLLQFSRIQWGLTVAMFPLVLFFYQSSSLVSPIANFVAIPVMSLAIVPLMFMAMLLLFLNEAAANALFILIDFIYDLLWMFLEYLSSWQFATLDSSVSSIWVLLFCYIAIVLWLLVKGAPMRWLALIFILPILFASNKALDKGEAKVTVLDVGQGLSVVVQTKNHTLVFDTGPKFSKSFDTGRAVVLPYLNFERRATIDTVIISHGDNDHIGGFNSIADVVPIKHVLTSIPDFFTNSNIPVSACLTGKQWKYDGVIFEIISPLSLTVSDNGHDENNLSCVLKVSTEYGRVLIAGDIERETESYLYHSKPLNLAAEVLVVPHHGSNTSSLAKFIQVVKPDYAVFTVGYKNRYKLPNKKVVARYKRFSDAELIKSSHSGALIFSLQANKPLKPRRYRDEARRYWHTLAID